MGLFKKKDKTLYAFTSGRSVSIEDVPDEVFSQKMMGDGIAIIPDTGSIYAPCSGKISVVMDKSKHAIGLENTDGLELLIHVGLDTVNLFGEGFETHVIVGDVVQKGDLLITFDKALLKSKGINLITMLVIIDKKNYVISEYNINQEVEQKTTPLIKYK